MSVSLDLAQAGAGWTVATTTKTWNHASGVNANYGVVVLTGVNPMTNPTATWGGVAMEKVIQYTAPSDNNSNTTIFRLFHPPGGTQAIVVSWTGNASGTAGSYSLKGAGARLPTSGYAYGTGATVSVTVASGGADMLLHCSVHRIAGAATPTSGQTLDWNYGAIGWGWSEHMAGGAASQVLNTTVNGGANIWAAVAISVPPAATGGIWHFFKRWQRFVEELKAGLVPPDVLRRRYGDLMTI